MKKFLYMAVVAIAALSSCSSDKDPVIDETGKLALTFTATTESDATRATYDEVYKCASWEKGDQISINGKTYNAQKSGITTTFKAAVEGQEAEGPSYDAYFGCTYDGTTATLPAEVSETWAEGKFNMPMYATSTTTDLAFKNLCGVLKITIKSDQHHAVRRIRISSANKAISGAFTVNTNNEAVLTNASNVDNTLTVTYTETIPTTEEGTVFYIPIPAQIYRELKIELDDNDYGFFDNKTMTTKDGANITVARNTIYPITFVAQDDMPFGRGTAKITGDIDVPWVRLWENGPKFAIYNVGAEKNTETPFYDFGNAYCWGSNIVEELGPDQYPDELKYKEGPDALSGNDDTATSVWGSNWRMPTKKEFEDLIANCKATWGVLSGNTWGWIFEGTGRYSNNYLRFPVELNHSIYDPDDTYYCSDYWTSTPDEKYYSSTSFYEYDKCAYSMSLDDDRKIFCCGWRYNQFYVRAVLAESTLKTTGTAKRTGNIDVKWVQLWENGPKFAEYNVGAANSKAEDFGGYYCWGTSIDTAPDYNTYRRGTDPLSGTDDTATNLWGSNWRMPTKEEYQALYDNCVVEWTTVNGVPGRKYTGKDDYASNSVFLPAAGGSAMGGVDNDNTYGFYWSSTPVAEQSAFRLVFSSSAQLALNAMTRYYGYSIRAVLAE